jgi:membrane associated rhomboid family serine protease
MSGFFATRGPDSEPWFRLGRVEVTTTAFVVGVVVITWLAAVIVPSLPGQLYFAPGLPGAGQWWRALTWPLANQIGLWSVLTAFFLWYFGTDLERQVGRRRMLWLLVGIWAALTAATLVVGLLLPGLVGLAGISLIEFAILLVWIAEYPQRRFFFNIPAWVIGLVLVGVQVLMAIADRDVGNLLGLLLGLAFIAIAARSAGLLTLYPWIPGGRTRQRPTARTAAPRSSRREQRDQQRRRTDRERLDDLLDLINEKGIGGLSDAQRRELLQLRERLKRS